MRVVTFNANGLRSAARKGFFRWFARQRADVLCVQELKAHDEQIAAKAFHSRGYHRACVHAEKPGYSGVAIYSRAEPAEIVRGIGDAEFDREGRYAEARFRDIVVVTANNTGWRIDYQVVSPALGAAVRSAGIYKRRRRYSDHAPLTIDYDWPLK